MRIYLLVMIGLISQLVFGQNIDSIKYSFLVNEVLSDSIDLSFLPNKPLHIDTIDFMEEVFVFQIIEGHDSTRVSNDLIINQVNENNAFKWEELSDEKFKYITNSEASSKKNDNISHKANYSLPIVVDENLIIMFYYWNFGPLYAGMSIDYWAFSEGKWTKKDSRIIWMS